MQAWWVSVYLWNGSQKGKALNGSGNQPLDCCLPWAKGRAGGQRLSDLPDSEAVLSTFPSPPHLLSTKRGSQPPCLKLLDLLPLAARHWCRLPWLSEIWLGTWWMIIPFLFFCTIYVMCIFLYDAAFFYAEVEYLIHITEQSIGFSSIAVT